MAIIFASSAVRSEPVPFQPPSDDADVRARDLCAARAASAAESCEIRCFRADRVCGANGVTYTCGCPEARCNGVRVVKLGPCDTGGSVSGQALLLDHVARPLLLASLVLFDFW
ncbi:hypothetical protein RJ640_023644 [Escallonia rubra]|uniref:Kazal-like domain-containing protein n=1 Tax=Escallonia rubra TaxID=112253 RepID=A0AA88UN13_9ASTE|nr:hypothetical protein RJ640_023644 [Escallonia rubra]